MILIYAYGSGIGHLKRVSDFLQYRQIPPAECMVLTQNSDAFFWEKNWKVTQFPREIFQNSGLFADAFRRIIFEFNCNEIIVDVFPEGFFGEISEAMKLFRGKKRLLARILQREYFTKYPPETLYDEVYLLEKGISEDHYLSQKTFAERLPYHFNDDRSLAVPASAFRLVIHSQPAQEVVNLIRQAEMHGPKIPVFVFANCELPAEITGRHTVFSGRQPPLSFLEKAEKIFSAAGFNAVRMLENFKTKTEFVPFPRVYDDQFLRKRLMRSPE